MSAETIAIVISAAGLLLGLAVGFGWMIQRTDDGFKSLRDELGGEINGLRDEVGGEMKNLRDELGGEIKVLRDELRGEIKRVRDELGGEIKRVRDELGGEIKGVRQELVEVKIAVARIEGPGRHLIAR